MYSFENSKKGDFNKEKLKSFYSKLSKKEKILLKEAANLIPAKKEQALTFNDILNFEKVKELLLPLQKKYGLPLDWLLRKLPEFVEKQILFPITVLNEKLTVLEAIVKYLKEVQKISFHDISEIIKRDERNVWHIYNHSKKKYSKKFVIQETKFWIPISIFSNEKLSALESLVFYLKEEFSLSYHEIAVLLKRNDRTVWTVYQRAKRKNAVEK